MLTYLFDDIGSESLYEYLYRCIKADILNKKLKAGEKLPSKRSFAKNLNISVITVENAYAQLMVEGYIRSEEKRGYFVSDIADFAAAASTPPAAGGAREEKAEYFADFVANSTDRRSFPFSVWTRLMKEVTSSEDSVSLLKSAPPGGVYELRQAIAKHLRDFRGMEAEPQQIIIGAGTEYLYGLIIQLLGHGSVFAVEDPGYTKIASVYEANGVRCAHIAMDECGVSPAMLEASGAEILHISPSHHFPTGMVMPISRRYELLGWAAKAEGRYIIEDDYDCEFRLYGKPVPALMSVDALGKVIYVNTFSKSLAPSFRISYMVLPRRLTALFYRKLGFYACTVSNFEQYTLAKFISGGYFEKHINRMRNHYRALRDTIIAAIKDSAMSGRVRIREEDSGLHFLLDVDTPLPDAEIVLNAKARSVRLACLSQYYRNPTEAKSGTVILNYAGVPEDRAREAVRRIAGAVLCDVPEQTPDPDTRCP